MIIELNTSPNWFGPFLLLGVGMQVLGAVLLLFCPKPTRRLPGFLPPGLLCCGAVILCLLGLRDADYTLLLGEFILLVVFWRLARPRHYG